MRDAVCSLCDCNYNHRCHHTGIIIITIIIITIIIITTFCNIFKFFNRSSGNLAAMFTCKGFRVLLLGVYGSVFRVDICGSGFGVQGLGFRV